MNDIEMGPDTTAPRRRFVTGAVVLVLALIVGGVAVAAGRGGSATGTGLALLPVPVAAPALAPASASASGVMAQSSGQPSVAEAYPEPVSYRLKGTLPALAAQAPAYRLDAGVNEAGATKLALAFGLHTALKSGPSGWSTTDGARRLDVSQGNGGQWSYSGDAGNSCVGIAAVSGGSGGIVCSSGGAGIGVAGAGAASAGAAGATAGVAGAGAASAGAAGAGAAGAGAAGVAEAGKPGQVGGVVGSAAGSAPSVAPGFRTPAPGGPTTGTPQKVPQVVMVPPLVISGCPSHLVAGAASCPGGSACSNSCPSPPRQADLASPAEAATDARLLLAKAGVDLKGADVKVRADPEADVVTVEPAVDGVPTMGMTISVTFGAKAAIQYASGVLASPVKLGEYPLIGTAQGFKQLQSGRWILQGGIRPMAGSSNAPALAAGGAPGLPNREVTVTGAHLVLIRVLGTDRQSYLEPAYVFHTATVSWTPPVPAVVVRLFQIAPIGETPNSKPKAQPLPAPAPAQPAATPGPEPVPAHATTAQPGATPRPTP